jgi:hypothetical protein
MTSKLADDYSEINKRMEEIKAERQSHIMGKPLEGEPTEAPADIDWTGMYGYPCGFYRVAEVKLRT